MKKDYKIPRAHLRFLIASDILAASEEPENPDDTPEDENPGGNPFPDLPSDDPAAPDIDWN